MIAQHSHVESIISAPAAAYDRAVVIGGSMAGLLAARVLSDHFREVVVVERDRLPDAPGFRKGVPQSRHLHVLLAGGAAIVERLFPGFRDEMLAAGAVPAELPRDARWLAAAGWAERFPGGLAILCSSHDLLEWTVRSRVMGLANVRMLSEREAVGLLTNSDRSIVSGVRLGVRGEADAGGTVDLPAALVVDAGGRRSRAAEWLSGLGYPAVEETAIDAFLGYASRQFAIPPQFEADWKILFLQAKAPQQARTGYLFPIEGNRWFVSMMGAARDYPPTDEDGFLAFARGLRDPILYETIKMAEPLTPIFGHRSTENRMRHFDRLRHRPEQFLITGDAACAFNPVYGQGMTVAARSAMTLDRCLRARPRDDNGVSAGLAHDFQREAAKTAADAWLIATGEDLRYPTTEGATPNLQTRMTHRYLDRVVATATHDAEVSRAFMDVINLTAPPMSLFRPSILTKVVRGRASRAASANSSTRSAASGRTDRLGEEMI